MNKTQAEIRDNERGVVYYESYFSGMSGRLLTIEEYDAISKKVYDMIEEFNRAVL